VKFLWSKITKPVFVLAPLAEITTLPFRSICKEMGADIVFTPMLSSNAIVYNPKETYKIAEFLPQEQPVIVQIFGYDGEIIAKAANMVNDQLHPAGIDINMGCPAPKITGNECGSGLLRDYEKSLEIIKTVRAKFSGQLSVKIRLGWREYDVLPFIKELESIGIDAVTIHGRTAKQGYSGVADWNHIEEIARAVSIPVIGNGDIVTQEQAHSRLENSSLSGVMIGRGALGNPWIFRDIKKSVNTPVTTDELKAMIIDHTERTLDYLDNETRTMREMRKHYGWYLKSFPGAKVIRSEAMKVETLEELQTILNNLH
jgi:tRNA-dihydrouridine synthase B